MLKERSITTKNCTLTYTLPIKPKSNLSFENLVTKRLHICRVVFHNNKAYVSFF